MEVLRQIYRGEIDFYDRAPQNEECRQAVDELIEVSEALNATFSEEQKDLMEAFEFAHAKVADLEQEEVFCEGVRLGARLVREMEGE